MRWKVLRENSHSTWIQTDTLRQRHSHDKHVWYATCTQPAASAICICNNSFSLLQPFPPFFQPLPPTSSTPRPPDSSSVSVAYSWKLRTCITSGIYVRFSPACQQHHLLFTPAPRATAYFCMLHYANAVFSNYFTSPHPLASGNLSAICCIQNGKAVWLACDKLAWMLLWHSCQPSCMVICFGIDSDMCEYSSVH